MFIIHPCIDKHKNKNESQAFGLAIFVLQGALVSFV